MPRAVAVATGTADTQGVSGAQTLVGYSIRESAGTAAVATVILRNGTSTSDPAVAIIELAANASETRALPAVECASGVFVDRVAGETELVLYVA